MSLIKRFSDVVRANLNALLDAAEDPEKLMNQSILEMKEQEKRGKQELLKIAALHKLALNQRDQALADQIATQKEALAQTLAKVPAEIERAKKMRAELTKRLIKARMSGHKAELSAIQKDAQDYVNDESSFETFDRMAEKIETLEAYNEALSELSDHKAPPKLDLDSALDNLKQKSKAEGHFEDELDAFKKMLKDNDTKR